MSEKTATVGMPSSRHVRITRTAISPRFAMRIFESTTVLEVADWRGRILRAMGEEPANPIGWRVRRFATLDSTNRWLLDEARRGAAEGLVAVADEQTQGRGRRGRTWSAPPGSSLLVS